jgi:phospholipid/cholesterol/gamma-HCH transport system substrate-binding protein
MKQSRLSRESKVGIFVALGVSALLASILLFSGNGMFFVPTYHLKIEMKDVQGLGVGSIVTLAGLRIGNVSRIDIDSETNKMQVILLIEKRYQSRITRGAAASLKTQGALGDRYVYVEPHPQVGEILHEGEMIPTSESPDLLEWITTKGAEFSNILDVIKEVHRFVHNLNENDRSAIFMENLVEASKNLNGFLIEGRGALKDFHGLVADGSIKESTSRLSSIMRKIDRGEGTLGELINDPALHDRLMALIGENPRNKYMKSLLRQSIQTEDQNKK